MATLYEIKEGYLKLMVKIQEQGGELFPEDEEELNRISVDKTEKYESYCKLIRQLLSDAEQFKAEKDRFAEKQKAAEYTAQQIKEKLTLAMQESGETSYKTPLFSLSFRNSQAVRCDERLIPPEWFKIEYKLDKAGIKDALKNGKIIEGVELVTNTSLQIK